MSLDRSASTHVFSAGRATYLHLGCRCERNCLAGVQVCWWNKVMRKIASRQT